jgi:uncharacterized membrane protein YjdF
VQILHTPFSFTGPNHFFLAIFLSHIAKVFSSLLLTQEILTTQVCAHLSVDPTTLRPDLRHCCPILSTVKVIVTTSRRWNKPVLAYTLLLMTTNIDFFKRN